MNRSASSFRRVVALLLGIVLACHGTRTTTFRTAAPDDDNDDDPTDIKDAASIVQVYKYTADDDDDDSSEEIIPDFLQESSPHYRMVAFHDDDGNSCSTCPSNASSSSNSNDDSSSTTTFMDEYATLAHRLLQHTTLLHVHSISCSDYPSLCDNERTNTIRLYTPHQPHGSPLLLSHQFHPYKILDTLGLLPDSTMVRPFLNDQTYFGGNDGDAEQDGEFLRELEQVYRVKRGLLEHDMQFALEQWLRHFVVTPQTTIDVGSSSSTRRRQLRPAVVDTLRDTLDDLRTVLTEVPGGTRLGPLAADVRNNIGYITRDADGAYLRSILEEHTVRDWSAVCQSTQDGGSSYLCGVWKWLFRWAIGVREYTEAAVRPVAWPSMQRVIGRMQQEMGLLCAPQDDACIALVTQEIMVATKDDTANKREESYESQVLWLAELRQKMQRFLRKRQKKMLSLPYTADDDAVTQWPVRSHCPRCWMEEDGTATATRRNLTVTYAFIELEFGRSVLWKDVLPYYDIVYPEEESDFDGEDDQEALSS